MIEYTITFNSKDCSEYPMKDIKIKDFQLSEIKEKLQYLLYFDYNILLDNIEIFISKIKIKIND